MSDEEFQRARRPEQKEERRSALLATARTLLLEGASAQELSLNELARQAGMAKSNVYRYFESREAILLELLRQEWSLWYGELQSALQRTLPVSAAARKKPSRKASPDLARIDALCRQLAQTIAERPLLGQLCSILASVLEQNVAPETVRDFKLESIQFVVLLSNLLHAHCPELSAALYEELFHTAFPGLVGLWTFSHPSPAVQAVLADPRLAPFNHDFSRDFARYVSLLARGLLAEQLEG